MYIYNNKYYSNSNSNSYNSVYIYTCMCIYIYIYTYTGRRPLNIADSYKYKSVLIVKKKYKDFLIVIVKKIQINTEKKKIKK